jgi:Spy/CpxP family protein refolding chaperone
MMTILRTALILTVCVLAAPLGGAAGEPAVSPPPTSPFPPAAPGQVPSLGTPRPFAPQTAPGAFGAPGQIRVLPQASGTWWKNPDIAARIQLTEPQTAQIDQVYLEYRLRVVDMQGAVEKEELRLQPLLDVDRPDETQVATQVDRVAAARGRLERENVLMQLAIRRVLSVEQWKRLQTVQQEREQAIRRAFSGAGSQPMPQGGPFGAPRPPAAPPASAPRQ